MEQSNSQLIRVLVVDDSAVMRTALTHLIESDSAMKVVSTAQDGAEALEKIAAFQPDVVTLDVQMPRLNGLEALKHIMAHHPRPVLMISVATQEEAESTFEALSLGAFDYVPKQTTSSWSITAVRNELITKIRAAYLSQRHRQQQAAAPSITVLRSSAAPVPGIVAIGTSTGGPRALQEVLPLLPADLPVGILVVQHMPSGFTGPFAERLNRLCQVEVIEAVNGQAILPATVYLAPAGLHMTVEHGLANSPRICLSEKPLGTLHTPSVDVTMISVAREFGSSAMGIILTGMGSDGAQGMQAIFQAGGITVGQDEATSVIYGMPRACAELGVLQHIVPLQQVPEQILTSLKHSARHVLLR